jgi:hypothetical protein
MSREIRMAAKRGWAALAQDWAMDEQGRDPSGKFSAAKFYAPAQDAQDCWASMAKDWGPSCAKKAMDDDMGDMSAMDAGDGWSAMCAGWGGGAAAMDADFEESKHPRADNGQFGAGAVGSSKAGLSSNKMTNHKLPTKTPSFNKLPLLSSHVPVDSESYAPELVVGATGERASFKSPYLYQSLVIWAQPAIDGISDNSKKELSAAYHYTPNRGGHD